MTDRRTIYLIRHGQTEWNLEKRLQGGKDSPLTELGCRQAEALSRSLKNVPPAHLYVSPLGRARKTADIIAKGYGIEVTADDRLAEQSFGLAEGLTFPEIDARWPDLRSRRDQDKWHVPWPEGECYRDVDERLSPFVSGVLEPALRRLDTGPVGVVGHETMNMILLGRLLGLDPSTIIRLGQPNHVIYRLKGPVIEHAFLGDDDLEWQPGAVQKRSHDVIMLNIGGVTTSLTPV